MKINRERVRESEDTTHPAGFEEGHDPGNEASFGNRMFHSLASR